MKIIEYLTIHSRLTIEEIKELESKGINCSQWVSRIIALANKGFSLEYIIKLIKS